jgi:transposase
LSWDRFSETRFGDFKLPAGSGRPAGISKALSLDLRSRVLAAIFGGLSSRQAAERFGVSASSAIRWRARQREQGDARPKALGGEHRSGRMEAHAALIGSLVDETPDITLDEFRAALADRAFFGRLRHVVARLSQRHKITREKDGACRRAGRA